MESPSLNPNPKRGRGRPPKLPSPAQPTSEAHQSGSGSHHPSRKRGRPAKLQLPPPPPSHATSEKRPRGRPPKQQQVPAVVPFASELGSADGRPRPRGRPRKSGIPVVKSVVGKLPRGRPRSMGMGLVVDGGRRRGRPAKGVGVSPRKPRRRLSGKPLGRPRKVDVLRNLTSEQGQGIPNEELTSKLELVQLKVREAIGIIRPYVANEYAAIMALQQLEELMTTNIDGSPATSMGPPTPPSPVNFAVDPSLTQPATVPEAGLGPAPGHVSGPFFGVPGPFSVNLPPLNVTGPVHMPFVMESQQTMSWFPSGGAQS